MGWFRTYVVTTGTNGGPGWPGGESSGGGGGPAYVATFAPEDWLGGVGADSIDFVTGDHGAGTNPRVQVEYDTGEEHFQIVASGVDTIVDVDGNVVLSAVEAFRGRVSIW